MWKLRSRERKAKLPLISAFCSICLIIFRKKRWFSNHRDLYHREFLNRKQIKFHFFILSCPSASKIKRLTRSLFKSSRSFSKAIQSEEVFNIFRFFSSNSF